MDNVLLRQSMDIIGLPKTIFTAQSEPVEPYLVAGGASIQCVCTFAFVPETQSSSLVD